MKFKDEEIQRRFSLMHEQTQKLAIEMDNWARNKFNIELTLTATVSTKEEDMELARVSDTHRTGRAFDVRTKDLPENLIAELCKHFRKKYSNIAALSGGQKNLIVYRPHGTGSHLHIQLNRNFSIGDINVEESIKKE